MHTFDANAWEAEAGTALLVRVLGLPELLDREAPRPSPPHTHNHRHHPARSDKEGKGKENDTTLSYFIYFPTSLITFLSLSITFYTFFPILILS